MNWIKVIFINFGVTFCLLGILLTLPPLSYLFYSLFAGSPIDREISDMRPELSLYEKFPWANRHFVEMDELATSYYDFITWRRDDYSGETINILNGVRNTVGSKSFNNESLDYYFFGGSTTWGTGVNDANTYPSLFAQLSNRNVVNLGESAYIARQSLAYLNNLIIFESMFDLSDKHVVFYDGVNDVASRCRAEISGLGTGREEQIQNKLSPVSYNKYSFEVTFSQLFRFISSLGRRLGIIEIRTDDASYDCFSSPERAQEVARTLVDTWQSSSNLVKQHGGKFTAILQPVAFIGKPDTSYLNLINNDYLNLTSKNNLALARQYQAVYPIIKEIAESRDIDFIDLTKIYDNCNNCYIDFCHVGPQAHHILASNLIVNLLK